MRIVTDSSVDMPEGWLDTYHIHLLPININLGGKSYRQGIDLGYQDFYRLVDELKAIPKTSLPSPDQVMEFYRKIAKMGETILSIHLSSRLSGTLGQVQIAAQRLKGEFNVVPFDSGSGSAVMAFMCREARLMERGGAGIDEILNQLKEIRNRVAIVFTVDNLEFAHMSGRVNALQTTLASILQIKPIIVLRDGLLEIGERARTRRKSIDRVVELIRQRVGARRVNLAVVHAHDPDAGLNLLELARQKFNCNESILMDLSISVAAHLGPGTVGIVAYPVDEG